MLSPVEISQLRTVLIVQTFALTVSSSEILIVAQVMDNSKTVPSPLRRRSIRMRAMTMKRFMPVSRMRSAV